MTFSFSSLIRAAGLKAGGLALALIPASFAEAHTGAIAQRSLPPPRTTSVMVNSRPHQPYLAAIGPSPLRFAVAPTGIADAPPPSPFKPRLAIAPPPKPVEPTRLVHEAPPPITPPPKPEETPPPPDNAKPLGILPDDTHREIRAEEVIPFFQFPTGTDNPGSVDVILPFTPAQPRGPALPPSSATYQQK